MLLGPESFLPFVQHNSREPFFLSWLWVVVSSQCSVRNGHYNINTSLLQHSVVFKSWVSGETEAVSAAFPCWPPSPLMSLWDGLWRCSGHILSGTKRPVKARMRDSNKASSLLTLSSSDQQTFLSRTCIYNFSNTKCTLWAGGGGCLCFLYLRCFASACDHIKLSEPVPRAVI